VKLTWFGGTTLRVYIGGEIIVVDADQTPAGVDRGEVLSGADRAVRLGEGPAVDPAGWRPKPVPRGFEVSPPVEIMSLGRHVSLIAAAGEPPLVVIGPDLWSGYGRWADGAVIVLTSGRESLMAEVTVLLDVARPRLIALAVDEQTLDTTIDELSEHLDGTGLVSLEPGLALEV
jgi:hypothetical protein